MKFTSESPVNPRRAMGIWLIIVAFFVFAMVLVGGATRLTGSGLSMVDWRPVTGWLPPLNTGEWQAVFARYKTSPEFIQRNLWMELGDFKQIFWLEYLHRLFGRIIGLVYALPLLFFWWRGAVKGPDRWRLTGLLILGGLQGGIGWWMVKSGLVATPEVSHVRLAVHLGLAVVIFSGLFWQAISCLQLPDSTRAATPAPGAGGALAALLLLYVQILFGAFVAGLDAGMAYNTFPLMDGHWLAPEALHMQPWWRNVIDNPAMVQFLHRLGGVLLLAGLLWLCFRVRRTVFLHGGRRRTVWVAAGVAIAVMAQFALGIVTLLAQAPLNLALWHQAGAMVLLSGVLLLLFQLRRGNQIV